MSMFNENYIKWHKYLGISKEGAVGISEYCRSINQEIKNHGLRDTYRRSFVKVLKNGTVLIKYWPANFKLIDGFFSKYYLKANFKFGPGRSIYPRMNSLVVDITPYVKKFTK